MDDVFIEPDVPLPTIDQADPLPKLFVAPARISLAKLEARLVGGVGRAVPAQGPAGQARRASPTWSSTARRPSGLLTVNALVAATHLLIPIQSSYFALEGTDDLLETIEKVRQRPNPALKILGVVITMHDKRTALGRDIREQIRKVFGDKVFRTVISKSVRLEESPGVSGVDFHVRARVVGRQRVLQPVRGGD